MCAWKFNPFTGNLDYYESPSSGGSVTYSDDGTNISIIADGNTILKYRKSDGQILLDEGVSDEAF